MIVIIVLSLSRKRINGLTFILRLRMTLRVLIRRGESTFISKETILSRANDIGTGPTQF